MADRVALFPHPGGAPHADESLEPSPPEILRRLESESLDHQDRRQLIIESEVLDFEPSQSGPLNAVLRRFIADHRESNDPADLVAVGAAIRKCVATLVADEALAYAALLLEAGSRAQVPLEIEMELVKMVVRKLIANPPNRKDSLPELGGQLREIARTYLSPRLLSREKYGAIALNAILALVLLQSRYVAEILQLVSELNVPWFRQLLARRARRLHHDLMESLPGSPSDGLIGSLAELQTRQS